MLQAQYGSVLLPSRVPKPKRSKRKTNTQNESLVRRNTTAESDASRTKEVLNKENSSRRKVSDIFLFISTPRVLPA